MAAKSSDFYRLEKKINNLYTMVYEFHSVVNGKTYIAQFEERDGRPCWIGKTIDCTREYGNNFYKALKADGYRFAGKFVMDILGHKTLA